MDLSKSNMRLIKDNSDSRLARREADLDLAAACVQNDPDARRQLAARVFDVAVNTVSYAVNGRVFAEDLAQDALMEILDSMKYFRGECTLDTWARKISLRTASKYIKKQQRRQGLMNRMVRETVMDDHFDGVGYSNRELRILLNGVLHRLPAKQRNVVMLKYVFEHSVAEISQIVEAPPETVRFRLKAGKKKLQKIIEGIPAFESWLKKGT